MPSFSGFFKILLQKQIAKSLQVPCIFPLKHYRALSLTGKRVLPFASWAAERVSASMTVEAALCLPLFLFFAAALMEPMRWLDRQRKVQTVTEHVCADLSQYMYGKELGETVFGRYEDNGEDHGNALDSGRNSDLSSQADENYLNLLSEAAAGLWLKGKVGEYAEDVVIRTAKVPDKDADILFEAEYKEQIPFFQIKPGGITMHVAAKRRSWIGIDGKLKSESQSGSAAGDTDGTIVYVGAGMGKYHLYRDCHYISNQYKTVAFSQIAQMRNAFGGRYTACARCAKNAGSASAVYITEAGEHYHLNRSCSSMASYVRSVPLKEAEHLGICSYCAGKKAGGE